MPKSLNIALIIVPYFLCIAFVYIGFTGVNATTFHSLKLIVDNIVGPVVYALMSFTIGMYYTRKFFVTPKVPTNNENDTK